MSDGSAVDTGRPPDAEGRSERPSKSPDPLIGRVVNDRFRIVSLIARGGMGKVYRAEQAPLGREVALKVLNPNYSGDGDPEFHKRFFLEASTCAKLSHPNTVTIFDYGRTDDDVYYIAMELLEGRTLHRLLRDDGPMSAARTMHIGRQICRSLREAHGLGVIHRDLKPANIFLVEHGDEADFVKVLDFGLVKDLDEAGDNLTETGLFMGSPKYMSPEQIRGENVDTRADIYALGVILYEAICGKVPFDRPNSVNILMAHVHEAPPPILESNPAAEVSPELAAIVVKALSKRPDDRFASMDQMLVALKDASNDSLISMTRRRDGDEGAAGTTGQYGAAESGPPPAIITGETSAHGPVATAQPARVDDEVQGSRSPRTIVIALAGALALALAAAVAVMAGGGPDEARPPEPITLPNPSARPEPGDDPPAPAPPSTMVVLRSTPPGAMVRVEQETIGPTPRDVEWSGDEAELGRRVTFLFELDGYRNYAVTRVITGARLEVEATLEEIERVPRPTTRGHRRDTQGAGSAGQVGPIKGYKLDPY